MRVSNNAEQAPDLQKVALQLQRAIGVVIDSSVDMGFTLNRMCCWILGIGASISPEATLMQQ